MFYKLLRSSYTRHTQATINQLLIQFVGGRVSDGGYLNPLLWGRSTVIGKDLLCP